MLLARERLPASERRVLFATAFVAAVFLIVGILPPVLYTIVRSRGDQALRRTDALGSSSSQIAGMIVDEETAVRGYIITEQPDFLTPYNQAEAQLPSVWATAARRARSVGGDGPKLVDNLRTSATAWQQQWAVPEINLVQNGRQTAATALDVNAQGKSLLDAVRSQSAALDAFVLQTRDSQVSLRNGLLGWLTIALILLAIAGVAALLLLYYINVITRRALLVTARTEAVAAAKDEFLSLAGHELKTPLTTIKGQAQMLIRMLSRQPEGGDLPLPRRMTEQLRSIERQTNRMARLINEMLDASRAESHGLALERRTVDLVEIARHAVVSHQVLVSGPRLQAGLPDRTILIDADPARIEQVLSGLLDNAARFAADTEQIWLDLSEDGEQAICAVRDEGIGIPLGEQTRLFELFFRASNVGSRSISGLGVGLYLCSVITRLHGGTILVDSEPGRGSTFTLQLPLAADRLDAAEAAGS